MQKHCKQCERELDSLLPFQCKRCNQYFCEEHRLPEQHNCANIKTSWDSWKKRQRKLQDIPEERHTTHYTPIQNVQKANYVYPREDNLMERRYQSYGGKLKNKYRSLPKLHLSNLAMFFFGALIFFLILHLILMVVTSKELWIIYIVILCVAEVIGLLWLLFKLDRISTHNTLRLWGLRILAGIIAFFGIYILILLWISSMLYSMFYPFYPKMDSTITFLSYLPFLIPGIGLAGIGAYLEFKFKLGSGVIVYRG
jgi:hypothetical protein